MRARILSEPGARPAACGPGAVLLRLRGGSEHVQLRGGQAPRLAWSEVAELQGAEADPHELLDRASDRLTHATDLAVAALVDRQLHLVGREPAHLRRGRHAVLQLDALAQRLQRAIRERRAAERRAVGLRHLVARVREAVREVAVV